MNKLWELPKDWKWVKLGEVCDIFDSARIPVKKNNRVSGDIPYCGANGIVDFVNEYTHEGEYVLIAEDGGFYKSFEPSAYIMKGRFWANNHVHVVKGKVDRIINKYLNFYLYRADLTPFLSGSTRPKLNQKALLNIPIPLPPLSEQKRIVQKIESVMTRINEIKKHIQKAKEEVQTLWKSVLARTFPQPNSELPKNWKWVKLGEVCEIRTSSIYPNKNPTGKFYLYSIPAYDNQNGPELKYGKEINSSKIRIKSGVCLFSKLNPDKPRVWIIRETPHNGELIASTEFLPLYPKQELISLEYLGEYLKSETFLSQILRYATGATSSRQRVNRDYVMNALIPLPPL